MENNSSVEYSTDSGKQYKQIILITSFTMTEKVSGWCLTLPTIWYETYFKNYNKFNYSYFYTKEQNHSSRAH